MNFLQPVNKTERETTEVVQNTANQVISRALVELRRADAVHAIGNQLVELMAHETRDHREMTDAWQHLATALHSLNDAERSIRARGEAYS